MKIYDSIPPTLLAWAEKQPIFFVASAPLTGKHVNCSPKGLPNASFKIFDSTSCAYIDYTGSGSETIAHCYENGRVTLMWCSFDKLPRILRFFCHGSVIEKDDARFEPMLKQMGKEKDAGQRAIIMLKVWKVTTSCGTGVPYVGRPPTEGEETATGDDVDNHLVPEDALKVFKDRPSMPHWCRKMEESNRMIPWWKQHNAESIDGVPAMKWSRRAKGQWMLLTDVKYALRRSLSETYGMVIGFFLALALVVFLNAAGFDSGRLLVEPVVGRV